MAREFEIDVQNEFPTTPDVLFEAVTAGSAGWLWPMAAPEPQVGGSAGMDAQVIAWDPPHHYGNRIEADNGFYNELEFRIGHERHPVDGTTYSTLHYIHSGVFLEDFSDDQWAVQYDGICAHTKFYQHTLGEYVKYFPWQNAAFLSATAPPASQDGEGFTTLLNAVGVESLGDPVSFDVPSVGTITGEVDYLCENFAGLRTSNSLIRFFGRNAFGAPVSVSVHEFGGPVMGAPIPHAAAWQGWLSGLYVPSERD